jgi:hypothetical protein
VMSGTARYGPAPREKEHRRLLRPSPALLFVSSTTLPPHRTGSTRTGWHPTWSAGGIAPGGSVRPPTTQTTTERRHRCESSS